MELNKETLKILTVDDSNASLKILKSALMKGGFQNIIKSNSGTEALSLALEHQPDLIISDIIMPEMDGGRFRELLKKNPATRDIPVIFLSGIISEEEEKDNAGRLGKRDLLISKPYSSDRIAGAIEAVFRRNSSRRRK